MRVIVFFDLPVKTKKHRRIYTRFRKHLIETGHMMMQYSVYSKIVNNREAAMLHLKNIESNAPKEGNVRILTLTEKQYANMLIVTGDKTTQENLIKEDPFILL